MDMTRPAGLNEFTPAYVIYENRELSKVALFNYINDIQEMQGNTNLTITLLLPNSRVLQTVKVKYLEAQSVLSKFNIIWASQISDY